MKEIYKDVKGYEGFYQVSDKGNVKSLSRTIITKRGVSQDFPSVNLKPIKHNSGYIQYCLARDGSRKKMLAHQLVAIAFLNHDTKDRKIVVDHIDNDKKNNLVSNLQVISARENVSKDRAGKTSKYTGVHHAKKRNKWYSTIRVKGIKKFLGSYDREKDASDAYQKELKTIIVL